MKHLRWPIVGFENMSRIKETDPHLSDIGDTRYPLRMYRYWFGLAALMDLHKRLGRPLRVLEVGIDIGQMPAFMGGPARNDGTFALPDWVAEWVGVDIDANEKFLKRYSYTAFYERNIEEPINIDAPPFDAVVLLHVLEHLLEPEKAMERLLPLLAPGGQMIGGSPTLPTFVAGRHEATLRRKAAHLMHDVHLNKHLSVITTQRVRRFAADHNMKVDVLTGAFFVRRSGSALENSLAWYKANRLWGALFPPLGNEVYFAIEKRA